MDSRASGCCPLCTAAIVDREDNPDAREPYVPRTMWTCEHGHRITQPTTPQPRKATMTEDQAVYMEEILRRTCDELFDRLETELTHKDALAITTAVGKAAQRGFRRGVATLFFEAEQVWKSVAEQIQPHLPSEVELPGRLVNVVLQDADGGEPSEPDPWLDEYQGEDV